MRTVRTLMPLLSLVLLVACTLQPLVPEMDQGVQIADAWAPPARQSTDGMSMGAIYLTLNNSGEEERLIGAQTEVAEKVEMHQTTRAGEVMKMSPVESIEIPGRGSVVLQPGGYHLMLVGLQRDLKLGDRFTVRLEFARSEPQTVEVVVRQP